MTVVLDSSAILTHLLSEPGEDLVTQAIASAAVMSSVSLAEVMTRLIRDGGPPNDVEEVLAALPVTIHAFDEAMALKAGAMVSMTRSFGLSLADRACLALARRENLPVLTADPAWEQAGPLVGVTVRLIR